jgi:hypothetical protein
MGIFTDIEAALNTRLSTLGSLPDVDWPNTEYTPVAGTLFLRPTNLPSSGALATIGGGYYYKGIYQIDIFCPTNKGISVLTGWMDAIQTLFAGTKTLTAGSTKVFVQDIVEGKGMREQAWYHGIISVHYICYN